MTTAAILLAAGGASRYRASLGVGGGSDGAVAAHKLLADLAGQPVYRHALDQVRAAAIGPVVVVTGAIEIELPGDVVHVTNPSWADGQAASLKVALAAAADLGADSAVIGLADQPGIPAEAWRRIATAPAGWRVVVASYDGRRGPHPVRLHRSLWAALPASGDQGARALFSSRADEVHEVACPGSAYDIDTLEDLQRWNGS